MSLFVSVSPCPNLFLGGYISNTDKRRWAKLRWPTGEGVGDRQGGETAEGGRSRRRRRRRRSSGLGGGPGRVCSRRGGDGRFEGGSRPWTRDAVPYFTQMTRTDGRAQWAALGARLGVGGGRFGRSRHAPFPHALARLCIDSASV